MAQFVYTMHRVGKVVPPKRHILKNISLSFFPGAKIGVLGLNGAGKSTLLRIMAGIDKDIEGEARPQPDIKIGYLPQEPQLNPEHTVRESIEEAVSEVVNALKRLDEVYALYADPDADFDKLAAEQGRLEEIIQAHDGHNLNVQLERAADALRLPDWDAKIANLSGGERRRVALCRLLLEKPDMLLLDEPTNHLDAESVAWLERFLHDFEGTVVAITHDRYFLDNVAGWILELDRGEGIPWEGNYSSWLEQKDQRLAQEASQEAARRKSIEKELEWVRQGTKGRQSKGKARLARFEELNSTEYQKRNETNELFIPPGPRLGDKVLEVSNLRKSYGDRLLIDDLSFSIPKGAIVGIIGPNGAGKSTLFRMISGQEQPDSGTITLGETVKLASVDQFRDSMDNSKTVWEEVSGGFTFFAEYLRDKLRLTAVVANELEIMDGKFTGNVIGDIVDAQYKAKTLTRLAQEYEIPLAQTVAIGDGANDLPMIKAAGLGIAYHAKPKVNEKAEVTIRHADLMGVFCILSGSLNQK